MRIEQTFKGSYAGPSPLALADFVGSGVSWDNFDMFDIAPGGKVDVQSTTTKFVAITDPVTNDMISKYLYWNAHKKVQVDTDKTVPGITINVVDTANWTLIYDNTITSRQTVVMTEDEAIAEYKRIVISEGRDPALVKVGLFNAIGNAIPTQGPDFALTAQQNGWTYHTETGPSEIVQDHNDVVTIIINVAKLRRDTAVDPTTKKKPDSVTFKVHFTATPDVPAGKGKGNFNWDIDGAIYKTTQTPPNKGGPLEGERRTFPVKDEHLEFPAFPGTFVDTYMIADFEGFHTQTFGSQNPRSGDPYVEVTVTFQKGTTPASVEFNGGPGTSSSSD